MNCSAFEASRKVAMDEAQNEGKNSTIRGKAGTEGQNTATGLTNPKVKSTPSESKPCSKHGRLSVEMC